MLYLCFVSLYYYRKEHVIGRVAYLLEKELYQRYLADIQISRKNISQITRRKFSKILKRAILQNSRGKTFVAKSVFIEIAGIDFKPATKLKRNFHQGGFFVNTSEFSVSLQKSLTYTT